METKLKEKPAQQTTLFRFGSVHPAAHIKYSPRRVEHRNDNNATREGK